MCKGGGGKGGVLRDCPMAKANAFPWVRAPVRAPKVEHGIAISRALRTNRALPHWLVKGEPFANAFRIAIAAALACERGAFQPILSPYPPLSQ